MASIGGVNKVCSYTVRCVTRLNLVSMADRETDIAAPAARRYGKALYDRLVISTNDRKAQRRSKAERLVVLGFGTNPGKLSEKSSNPHRYGGILRNHSVKDFDEHVRQVSADEPSVLNAFLLLGFLLCHNATPCVCCAPTLQNGGVNLIGFELKTAELAVGETVRLIEREAVTPYWCRLLAFLPFLIISLTEYLTHCVRHAFQGAAVKERHNRSLYNLAIGWTIHELLQPWTYPQPLPQRECHHAVEIGAGTSFDHSVDDIPVQVQDDAIAALSLRSDIYVSTLFRSRHAADVLQPGAASVVYQRQLGLELRPDLERLRKLDTGGEELPRLVVVRRQQIFHAGEIVATQDRFADIT